MKKKMSTKKKLRFAAVIVVILALIGGACYTVLIAPYLSQEQWVYIETEVVRGTLTVGVEESGSLEYGISTIDYDLDLSVTTSSDDDDDDDDEETVEKYLKVEEVYVASGQRIEEGDAILKFTDSSVSDVRKLLEAALVDARSDYAEAESTYELAVLEAQTTYETSKVAQSYASEIYEYSSSSVSDNIASLQIEITQMQAKTASLEEAVTEAQENFNDFLYGSEDDTDFEYYDYSALEELYQATLALAEEEGIENTANYMQIMDLYESKMSQYNNMVSAVENAQDALQEHLDQIEELQEELAQAQAKEAIGQLQASQTYEESVLEGENAQTTYNAAVEDLKEDLEEAAQELEEIQDQLAAFEEFVGDDSIIYADGSGIITGVGYEAGDTLTTSGTVISYAPTGDMTISIDSTQEDVVSMTVGDTVAIEFTAYPGEAYEGTILSIDTTATSRSSSTISYAVVIGVNGEEEALQKLYGGMTADITFITDQSADTLYVSRKAVVTENGKSYVYVLSDSDSGEYELQEVTTGLSNTSYIEILSGLEEGDIVYIASTVSSVEEVEDTSSDTTSTDTDSFDLSDFNMEDFDMSDFNMSDFDMGGGMSGGSAGGGR
ncbi:MAG: HlyD family efflux transporter periplasmic adaptor subunit [Lachnospiraceae bacterium]|nr:HlyD family efflux transporter periplasmic adaptor subunit [Lachnospiraceae bacterium]